MKEYAEIRGLALKSIDVAEKTMPRDSHAGAKFVADQLMKWAYAVRYVKAPK